MVADIGAEHGEELGRLGHLVRPVAPAVVEVHQARHIEVLAAVAVAVAPHHGAGQPLDADGGPDRGADGVHRHRDLPDLRAELGQNVRRRPVGRIHIGFRVRVAEAFLQHADLHAADAALQHLGVGVRLDIVLPRVHPVGARDRLQHQRIVADIAGHRPGVVHIDLDGHDAGIGHEPVRRLHAVNAAIGGRHADRPALVAADGHIDLAGRHQRRRAGGGAARGIAHAVRVVDRARRIGVAAAGKAEILAMRLALDGGARVQQPLDDGRVDVRHITFQRGRAVHHRHAGQHHIVLERDGLALQLTSRRALDPGLVVPSVVLVLLALRTVAGRARIADLRQVVGKAVNHVVGLDATGDEAEEGLHVVLAERQAHLVRDIAQLLRCRHLNWHFLPPSTSRCRSAEARIGAHHLGIAQVATVDLAGDFTLLQD